MKYIIPTVNVKRNWDQFAKPLDIGGHDGYTSGHKQGASMNEQEELVTTGEAMRMLGISRQRVNELASAGRIGRKIAGRYWVFTREEIQAYMQQPKNKGGRPSGEAENRTPA